MLIIFSFACGIGMAHAWKPHLNGIEKTTQIRFISPSLPAEYTLPVSKLTAVQISEAFKLAKKLDLPFEYVKDCCFDRGYRISEALMKNSLQHLRVIVEATGPAFGPFWDKWNEKYYWLTHTAPVLVDTKNQMWAVDPALAHAAIPLKVWLDKVAPPLAEVRIFLAHPYVYSADEISFSLRGGFKRAQVQEAVQGSLLGCWHLQNHKNSKKILSQEKPK